MAIKPIIDSRSTLGTALILLGITERNEVL